jgi:uncharacterized protein YbaR (Trm112 family)
LPQRKGGLEFLRGEAEILCRARRLVYAVRNGILVMLIEEARPA